MSVQVEKAQRQDLSLFEQMEQEPDTQDFIIPYSMKDHFEKFSDPEIVYLRLLSNGDVVGFFILGLDRGTQSIFLLLKDGRHHEINQQEKRDVNHAREIERYAIVTTSRWFDTNSHDRLPGYLRGQSRGSDSQRLKPVEKIVQDGGIVIFVGANEQLDIARVSRGQSIDLILNDLEQFLDTHFPFHDLDASIRKYINHQARLLCGLLLLAFLLG